MTETIKETLKKRFYELADKIQFYKCCPKDRENARMIELTLDTLKLNKMIYEDIEKKERRKRIQGRTI